MLQVCLMHVYIQIHFKAGKLQIKIAKPQVSRNSSNSSVDCKTVIGNGNLYPEMESNEYSSTRGSPTDVDVIVQTRHREGDECVQFIYAPPSFRRS